MFFIYLGKFAQMEYKDIIIKQQYFFIGVAGVGMSAIAQYLVGTGKTVAGSDRYFTDNTNKTRKQLENEGIHCFPQDGSGLTANFDMVVISTAVEETNVEYAKAVSLGIPLVHRSDMLAAIAQTKQTIAISGTSGKSTTVAMAYHILERNGLEPSLITGAGLTELQAIGKIGNAVAGKGKYLVIEADESDGSLVKYTPEIGVLLNIDKDHKELVELEQIFRTFKANTQSHFVCNGSQAASKPFSELDEKDFGTTENCGFQLHAFKQSIKGIDFKVNTVNFAIPILGLHNAENATAAVAVASLCGIATEQSAKALSSYRGIYRRMQVLESHPDILVIDDYAHNPAKIAAALKTAQQAGKRVWLWFQPHGFGPTRFLRSDFVQVISDTVRASDTIIFSEIYYAGGTVTKNISANDLITDLKAKNVNAHFVESKQDMYGFLKDKIQVGDVIMLCGARDPGLSDFTKKIAHELKNKLRFVVE